MLLRVGTAFACFVGATVLTYAGNVAVVHGAMDFSLQKLLNWDFCLGSLERIHLEDFDEQMFW